MSIPKASVGGCVTNQNPLELVYIPSSSPPSIESNALRPPLFSLGVSVAVLLVWYLYVVGYGKS